MIGWAASRRHPGGREHRVRAVRRLAQRVRAGGPVEVGEAQPQHDRAAHPVGRPQPAGHPVDQRRPAPRPPPRACATAGPAPAASRSSAAAGRAPRAAGRGCAPARAGAARRRGRAATPARPRAARPPRRRCGAPRRAASPAVTVADAPQPLDRQRVQELQLPSGGTTSSPSGLATPLATLARNFVRATPTRDRQPDLARAPARRSRAAISVGRAGDLAGRPRRGTPRRWRAPRPAGWCPRRSRTPPCSPRRRPDMRRRHDDGLRAQPPRLPRRPSRCAPRAPSPRSWRPAPRPARRSPAGRAARVIALLDRRVERVQVGVEDRLLSARTHVRSGVGWLARAKFRYVRSCLGDAEQ